jgi:hypothetical protein
MIIAMASRWPRLWAIAQRFVLIFAVGLVALPGLAGCSLAPGGGQIGAAIDQAREQGVNEVKKTNDDLLDLTSELACLPSIGSVGRMSDKVRQFYVLQQCGITNATPPAAPQAIAATSGPAPAAPASGPENDPAVDPPLTNSP